jgi:hypothetical protein
VCFHLFNCSVVCCSNSRFILRIARYFIRQVFVYSPPSPFWLVRYAYQFVAVFFKAVNDLLIKWWLFWTCHTLCTL